MAGGDIQVATEYSSPSGQVQLLTSPFLTEVIKLRAALYSPKFGIAKKKNCGNSGGKFYVENMW